MYLCFVSKHIPIAALNPYIRQGWRIKARVTSLGPIKEYRDKKTGALQRLMSAYLVDAQSSEIAMTMYADAFVRFEPLLEKRKVYFIGKASVKLVNKVYQHLPNPYSLNIYQVHSILALVSFSNEMCFQTSEIIPAPDDISIPVCPFSFVDIATVATLPMGSFVDVIGLVSHVGPMTIFPIKPGKSLPTKVRTLEITDRTARINCSLWNRDAEEHDEKTVPLNTVVALHLGKISPYNELSLSGPLAVVMSPDVAQKKNLLLFVCSSCLYISTQNMMTLHVQAGHNQSGSPAVLCLSHHSNSLLAFKGPRLTIGQTLANKIGQSPNEHFKGDMFTFAGTTLAISHETPEKMWYKAAPDNHAKVLSDGKDGWFCSKNSKTYSDYELRFVLNTRIADHTGSRFILTCHHTI
jgi:hypothetical protein